MSPLWLQPKDAFLHSAIPTFPRPTGPCAAPAQKFGNLLLGHAKLPYGAQSAVAVNGVKLAGEEWAGRERSQQECTGLTGAERDRPGLGETGQGGTGRD